MGGMMNSGDPTATFRIEAGELLEQVEQSLLDLDRRLGDMDLVNAVFRGLHTLKGSGAMFGFDALAAFTHPRRWWRGADPRRYAARRDRPQP